VVVGMSLVREHGRAQDADDDGIILGSGSH